MALNHNNFFEKITIFLLNFEKFIARIVQSYNGFIFLLSRSKYLVDCLYNFLYWKKKKSEYLMKFAIKITCTSKDRCETITLTCASASSLDLNHNQIIRAIKNGPTSVLPTHQIIEEEPCSDLQVFRLYQICFIAQ